MKKLSSYARRYLARATAVLLLLATYQLAHTRPPSREELSRLASDFRFSEAALPRLAGAEARRVRDVHPSLRHIAGWVSSVGAAVALNDLDGDGLPNDVCYVDPGVDKVLVAPAPGTRQRYALFTLEPSPLPYDAAPTAPTGCLPGDFNEDGLTDLLVYYWGRTPVAFLRLEEAAGPERPAPGPESYAAREVVPGGGRWYTNAATLADFDGDGHPDLFVANYFPDGARILDAHARGIEQMQDSMSLALNGGRNRLLLWKSPPAGAERSIRFEEAAGVLDEEVARGWTLAVGAADLDGDLLPELYCANDFGPDRLLHNLSSPGAPRFQLLEGVRTFTTPKSKVLGRDSFKGMGVDFGDLNGDGWPDLFVSNIGEEYALEESNFVFLSTGRTDLMKRGIAPYDDQSERLGLSRGGWGWDTRLDDFNNDGALELLQAAGFLRGEVNRWPDLHELAMGNDNLLRDPRSWPRFAPGDDLSGHDHNNFFVRAADGRYYDVAAELGLGHPRTSRGIATADVDGDGLLEFAVANQWDASFFHHNESRPAGAFLGLRLRLAVRGDSARTVVLPGSGPAPVAARPAIGAQARVFVSGRPAFVAQVDGGNGHSGKRSQDLHFGLGRVARDRELRVEVRWRDANGRPQSESLELLPDNWYTVVLGQGR